MTVYYNTERQDMCARVVQHARANVSRVGVGAGERKEREKRNSKNTHNVYKVHK